MYLCKIQLSNNVTGALDRQDVLNQACNHKCTYLFYFYLILPHFSNKKEYCSCEIAAMHAGFGNVQVGMATEMFVLILHVTGDQCQLWLYFIICLNMIVKHEFSYFKTCICFHTEQLSLEFCQINRSGYF